MDPELAYMVRKEQLRLLRLILLALPPASFHQIKGILNSNEFASTFGESILHPVEEGYSKLIRDFCWFESIKIQSVLRTCLDNKGTQLRLDNPGQIFLAMEIFNDCCADYDIEPID